MTQYRLGEIEAKFAALIWDNEPLTSGRLAELCRETLSWKKSTTYTVLRRLCQRGIVQNDGGVVTSLLSREEFSALQSEEVRHKYSYPDAFAAFAAAVDALKAILKNLGYHEKEGEGIWTL